MKCPMLTMYATTFKTPEEYTDRECLKGECAWWDEERKCCHIRTLSKQVDRLADRVNEIRDKMPHSR